MNNRILGFAVHEEIGDPFNAGEDSYLGAVIETVENNVVGSVRNGFAVEGWSSEKTGPYIGFAIKRSNGNDGDVEEAADILLSLDAAKEALSQLSKAIAFAEFQAEQQKVVAKPNKPENDNEETGIEEDNAHGF